ncbi:MAG: DM13 domain-containing protein [Acidimicrobiales bacterium]
MITETSTMSTTGTDGDPPPGSPAARTLIGRVTRFEIIVGALVAAFMLGLAVIEPNIVEAPLQNERTMLFTFGGTALAALAFVAMLWFRVPPVVRVTVLAVPFAIVNWWLISPYFRDEVVDESFSASISQQAAPAPDPASTVAPATPQLAPDEPAPAPGGTATTDEPTPERPPAAAVPSDEEPAPGGPVLLGAGQFAGLAGHAGSGDAGVFRNADGSLVLRFENFDIENGPDLEVYLVPGAGRTSLAEGSIHLGPLKGNVGDQNYDLPAGTELAAGAYTALVWCEAFSVEFVGATIALEAR